MHLSSCFDVIQFKSCFHSPEITTYPNLTTHFIVILLVKNDNLHLQLGTSIMMLQVPCISIRGVVPILSCTRLFATKPTISQNVAGILQKYPILTDRRILPNTYILDQDVAGKTRLHNSRFGII